jgi:hypothetical protein
MKRNHKLHEMLDPHDALTFFNKMQLLQVKVQIKQAIKMQ